MFTLLRNFCSLTAVMALAATAQVQPVLRLKGWNAEDASESGNRGIPHRVMRRGDRLHYLVQFGESPGKLQSAALQSRGAAVLSYVPDSALSISMRDNADVSGLGIRWIGQLQPGQKISPDLKLGRGASPPVIVEFYSDVSDSEARAIASGTGASIYDNPDLLPHHLLIEGTVDQVRQLADFVHIPGVGGFDSGCPAACLCRRTDGGRTGDTIGSVGG
ncbi:MAG TPA: hypothetical protein VFW44_12710 [Bryobacteraceae bacterium]|nr:hypothetical protein [Bryobacteraceae bacterium]